MEISSTSNSKAETTGISPCGWASILSPLPCVTAGSRQTALYACPTALKGAAESFDTRWSSPAIRQGLLAGRAEGRTEGRLEGERTLLLRLITKRFGAIAPEIRRRLDSLPTDQFEEAGVRMLDATRIEDLFPQ